MKVVYNKIFKILCIYLILLTNAVAEEDITGSWPQEIQVPEGVVVIYQPQPESLNGNQLKARAAVAIEVKNAKEPVFGAIWFEARLDTDRDTRLANITEVTINRVRFPNEDKTKSSRLIALLEKEIPRWEFPISMDQLLVTLETEDKRSEMAENISTEPPKIIFSNEPAVLISIDGEPQLRDVSGTKLKRIINTPYTIIYEPSSSTYYLNADKKRWYTASQIKGHWQLVMTVPGEVAKLAPEKEPGEDENKEIDLGSAPKIIVETVPAELISSTGKPKFTPITNTDLLYVSNTDSDVLKNIKDQNYYVLLSGRWYSSKNLKGPWKYVPGDQLSEDFAKIPEDSEMGTVLYAVPGTNVAEEAVLDAQIPQTAQIKRSEKKLTVEYDGEPKFEKIKNTKLTYAINTNVPIILFEDKYYACNDAVWFVANSAKGQWKVATVIPAEIYKIPTDSSLYYVTFVRIYKVTDDIVYMGYTPGYTGTYVYNTTIVYGTGYYWPGWYGHYYYPRRTTWGYHVRWNPRTGFRFGLSYSSGPFTFSIGRGGWHRGGWWGGRGYRGYKRGYRHGRRSGYRSGYKAGQRNAKRNNMYKTQNNKQRSSNKSGGARSSGSNQARSRSAAATNRSNNVFSDKNGNVHRKSDNGWQQRTNNGWNSTQAGARTNSSSTQQKRTGTSNRSSGRGQQSSSLQRSSSARSRGASRARSHRSSGGSRSRGGSRGGGGRR